MATIAVEAFDCKIAFAAEASDYTLASTAAAFTCASVAAEAFAHMKPTFA